MNLRIFLLALLSLIFIDCTCDHRWDPHQGGNCELVASKFEASEQSYWQATLGQPNQPALGCMQVSWGQKPSDAVTTLVSLNAAGQLRGVSDDLVPYGAPALTLPAAAKSSGTRRFRVFVFAPTHKGYLETCRRTMANTAYDCLADDASICWFTIAFQPTSTSDTKAALPPGGASCQLLRRGAPVPEPVPNEQLVDRPGASDGQADRFELPMTPDRPGESKPPVDQPGVDSPPTEVRPPDRISKVCRTTRVDQMARLSFVRGPGNVLIDSVRFGQKHIYVFGSTTGIQTVYDNGKGGTKLPTKAGADLFVLKLEPSGTLQWVRTSQSTGRDGPGDMVIDVRDNIYLTGSYKTTLEFHKKPSNLPTSVGDNTFFMTRLSAMGNVDAYFGLEKKTRGEASEGRGLVMSYRHDSVFVVGHYNGSFCPKGAPCLTPSTFTVPFVASLKTSLAPRWVKGFTYSGSKNPSAQARAIAVTPSDDLFILGTSRGELKYGQNTIHGAATERIFLVQLKSDGSYINRWLYGGTTTTDRAIGRALIYGEDGYLYITGSFKGSMRAGTITKTAKSAQDMF